MMTHKSFYNPTYSDSIQTTSTQLNVVNTTGLGNTILANEEASFKLIITVNTIIKKKYSCIEGSNFERT